ncbi:hypothetical protein BDA99DRAFT_520776 [Phascolomyces articulosus]|uniref:FAD-binding domain-containing protein n=1 Tax=Phascolomyces articulosus TaxID=60185 RepID=A0AAD5JSZ4_9FUNG|nr:hypothetical protein BDA99DRAFT_520776 [Phascolomyces articulosus]
MTIKNDSVIIIGAGVAGLALANILKYQGVPYKVFERDPTSDDRTQGWSISIHFCLLALKSSMDPIKYATLGEKSAVDPENPRTSTFSMLNGNTGESFFTFGDSHDDGVDIYRVNRKRFRTWLMEGIDVTWNKRLDHYTVVERGSGVEATFTDGTVVHGSIIVGADGINSEVCRQLIGTEEFAKTTISNPLKILAGSYWIDTEFRRHIEETLSKSHMMAIASSQEDGAHPTGLFSSLIDVDKSKEKPYRMMWSISTSDEKGPYCETDQKRLEQAKGWITKANFSGLLHRLVMETPEDTKVVPLNLRERSPHSKLDALQRNHPVVLIGDALHSMTMYRGEGANHAIEDSCLLGMKLADVYKGEKSMEEALDTYYKDALPRGRKAVAESHEAANMIHDSLDKVIEMINIASISAEERMKIINRENKLNISLENSNKA